MYALFIDEKKSHKHFCFHRGIYLRILIQNDLIDLNLDALA